MQATPRPLRFGAMLLLVLASILGPCQPAFGAEPEGGAGLGAGRWFCSDASGPDGCHNVLHAIAFLWPTDGWAVGNGGTALRWDDGRWTKISTPTSRNLLGLAFLTNTNGWAVGDGGTILHWDGQAWRAFASPVEDDLYGVAFASPVDGWIVGAYGTLLRWNGYAWVTADPPATGECAAIEMLSATDGWCARQLHNLALERREMGERRRRPGAALARAGYVLSEQWLGGRRGWPHCALERRGLGRRRQPDH